MTALMEFKWPVHRAGYALHKPTGKGAVELLSGIKVPRGLHLVPKGKAVDERNFQLISESIFRNFIDWEATPEGALRFTNAYGFLLSWDYEGASPSASVADWLHRQEGLRSAVRTWEAGDVTGLIERFNNPDLGELSTKLRSNRTGSSVSLVLEPRSLWSLMFVEFALHVSNKSGLKQCDWCTKWFPFGAGTGRRSKARFCSGVCRKASHVHDKKEQAK
jgi:hypothetical protein